MLINQSRAVHRYIILHLKFLQGIWWCPKSVCPWKISSFNVYTPCTHHTPCHTHVVWCHLRALIWLGGLGFSSVWFLFVSFDSSRFDTIRFDSIPFDPMLLVGFGFCSARSSTDFFFHIFIAFAGWPFILSKVQFIAKWNAAIPATISSPPPAHPWKSDSLGSSFAELFHVNFPCCSMFC